MAETAHNVYCVGDNVPLMRDLCADQSIDLVYTDPPYNTGRNFGDFDDRFDSMATYRSFLHDRIAQCHRVLKETGTCVIHVEPRVSHHVRIVCDEIFGEHNFVNEIVWQTGGNSKCTKSLQRFHDVLLVYAKRKTKQKFFPLYRPYDTAYKKKSNVKKCSHHQKEYITTAIHNSQPNVNPRLNLRYNWNGHHKQWYITKEKMQALHDDKRLVYNKKGIPRIKRFLDEMPGLPTRDVWTDVSNTQIGEKLQYATQKPVTLIKRILTLYTANNDLCLDPFAGSGTLGRACLAMGRRYILLDRNPQGKDVFDASITQSLVASATQSDSFVVQSAVASSPSTAPPDSKRPRLTRNF